VVCESWKRIDESVKRMRNQLDKWGRKSILFHTLQRKLTHCVSKCCLIFKANNVSVTNKNEDHKLFITQIIQAQLSAQKAKMGAKRSHAQLPFPVTTSKLLPLTSYSRLPMLRHFFKVCICKSILNNSLKNLC